MVDEEDEFSAVPSGIRKRRRKEKHKEKVEVEPKKEKKPVPAPAPHVKKRPAVVPKEEEKPALPPKKKPPVAPKEEERHVEEVPAPVAPKEEEKKVKKVVAPEKPALPAPKKEEMPSPPQPTPPKTPELKVPKKEEKRVEEVPAPKKEERPAAKHAKLRPHMASAPLTGPVRVQPDYTVSVPEAEGGRVSGRKLIYVLAIVVLVTIYFAYTASSDVARMKAEMRCMAEDLKVFRSKEVSITVPLEGVVTLNKELPLSNVFPSTLRVNGTLILPLKTTLIARSATGGTIYQIPLDQNISINYLLPLDFSKTGTGQSLLIDEELQLGNEVYIKVTARDIWGEELDSIISSLERAGSG